MMLVGMVVLNFFARTYMSSSGGSGGGTAAADKPKSS